MKPQTTSLLLAALALAGSSVTQATPYATALTNTGSRISFRLNESADAVKLIYNGGASELNLGALRAGLFSTNVVITGAFKVEAFKAAGLGYLYGVSNSVSFDTNQFVRFNSPRGVAVNRNPASPYFGRVYVGNSDAGTISGRAVGDGIYLLNADLSDAVGQGNVARTAGLVFTNAETANKPFRLEVGADDQLYISDYGTTNGNLLVADPNVSPGSGTNVFEYNPARAGRIPSSAIVRGSLAGGDLSVTAVYPDLNYEYDFFGFPGRPTAWSSAGTSATARCRRRPPRCG